MIEIDTNPWPKNIFLCIPAYKAVKDLKKFLPSLLLYAPHDKICIVDDASHDGTESLCVRFGIECLRQETNQGKGAALKKGFAHLLNRKAQWILTMDADGQHAVADITQFLDAVKKYPDAGLIIGARSIKVLTMPPERFFSNTVTSGILSLMCGQKILDSQCGYRIYSSKLFKKINLQHKRFEMESEVILKACSAGFEVRFIPVQTLYCSTRSHISHIKDILRWIRAVLGVWLELRFLKLSSHK